MKIKTKIRLGLLFLLALILLLAFSSSYYVNKLTNVSSAILKDNYESIQYTKNMIQSLDEGDDEVSVKKFEENLVAQEHNITEIGELDATRETRQIFELYKSGKRDDKMESLLRQKILHVQDLNMEAILRKNQASTHTAQRIFVYLTILGTLSFLLSFTFVVNFPSMIANPIVELTNGIKEIANRNYSSRLNFSSRDEFGEVADAFNTMARLLDEYEHSNLSKLMIEKRRIETIISNFKDAIIVLDERKHVLFANPVALNILGLNEKDMIGKYAADVAVYNDLFRVLLQNDEKDKLLKIFVDDKESYFARESLDIFNGGINIGIVIILRNITRFQELDVAKTNFIATISHELKTPISSIKMSLKLMEDKRIGSLNLQSIRPEQIVEQAVRSVQNMADLKHITIEPRYAPDLGTLRADADKTSWVLLNYLTNALRYAPANSKVIVSVSVQDRKTVFSVQDFGRGIESQYIPRVFDRYFQVPGTAASEGTGMGLAISKEIIEKQGGSVAAVSDFGRGSTFSFTLA